MYYEHQIIYSKDGEFPLLNLDGQPPEGLEWQKSRDHCLVISGKNHLKAAVDKAAPNGSQEDTTFQEVKRDVQEKKKGEKLLPGVKWTAKTALFLIRMFATAIG